MDLLPRLINTFIGSYTWKYKAIISFVTLGVVQSVVVLFY